MPNCGNAQHIRGKKKGQQHKLPKLLQLDFGRNEVINQYVKGKMEDALIPIRDSVDGLPIDAVHQGGKRHANHKDTEKQKLRIPLQERLLFHRNHVGQHDIENSYNNDNKIAKLKKLREFRVLFLPHCGIRYRQKNLPEGNKNHNHGRYGGQEVQYPTLGGGICPLFRCMSSAAAVLPRRIPGCPGTRPGPAGISVLRCSSRHRCALSPRSSSTHVNILP